MDRVTGGSKAAPGSAAAPEVPKPDARTPTTKTSDISGSIMNSPALQPSPATPVGIAPASGSPAPPSSTTPATGTSKLGATRIMSPETPADSERVSRTPVTAATAVADTAVSAIASPGTPSSQPVQKKQPTSPSVPPMAVIKEATVELGQAAAGVVQQGRDVVDALKNKRTINITLDQVVTALFFSFLGFQLLLIKLLRPTGSWLFSSLLLGLLVGLGLSFMFYYNKKAKAESCSVLGANVGLKGLQHLLGHLPSWLNYTEREKINWLNSVLEEVWPYYDKGVSKMVKKLAEGIFDQTLKVMKVPGIKRISFHHLTFGDAPFRVESIYVNDKRKDALVLELDVRWCGDANIALAIELSAGEFTKLCPRVTDISFVGSLRIVLSPLVDQIPGFGAAVVTFRKPPRVKYRLDFGKALGGPYAAGVVKPFINYVIDNVMVNMLVWPQRLVVPIINSEQMQIEIARLSYRSQGLVKVTINQATSLRKTDVLGSSDPFAEITTDGKQVFSTKVVKKSLSPVWNETFWLLVQEPTSQELKLTVYDKDFFSAKELLSLNLGSTFGARELLGRAAIKMAPISAAEPHPVQQWYHLGENDWSNPEGCGKGCGRVQLSACYRSLSSFTPEEVAGAEAGVLAVRVLQAANLSRGPGADRNLTAYVRVRCDEKTFMTPPVMSKAEHKWNNRNIAEFYGVKFSADVKLKVMERALQDDAIGVLEVPVSDVAAACDYNPLSGQREHGFMLRTFKLEDTDTGEVTISLRYVPYFR